jgi:hypothetical protein
VVKGVGYDYRTFTCPLLRAQWPQGHGVMPLFTKKDAEEIRDPHGPHLSLWSDSVPTRQFNVKVYYTFSTTTLRACGSLKSTVRRLSKTPWVAVR